MVTANQNPEPQNRALVRKAVGMNPLTYENLIHRFFVTWAEFMSVKFFYRDRDLITSEALFKYYQNQWAILVENRMMQEYGNYLKKDIAQTDKFYYEILKDYALELDKYYPASLLPKKKTTISKKYQFNYN